MSIGVDMICPVNRLAPLNVGRVAWWLCLPALTGTSRLFDVCNPGPLGQHGAPTAMDRTNWNTIQTHKGGWGSFTLNGSTQFVRVADSAAVDLAGSEATWAAWIYPTSLGVTAKNILVKVPLGGYQFAINTSSKLVLSINGSPTNSVASILTNTWQHVCATKRGGNTAVYINGNLDATGSGVAATMTVNATDLGIGANLTASPAAFFAGALDDLSMWNRCLSAGEVAQLYAASLGGYQHELNRMRQRRRGIELPAGLGPGQTWTAQARPTTWRARARGTTWTAPARPTTWRASR